MPALYNLARTGLLPPRFALIGVDHNDRSTDEWRGKIKEFLEEQVGKSSEGALKAIDDRYWSPIADAMSFLKGDFTDDGAFVALKQRLADCDKAKNLGGNVLFYLATADRFFATIAQKLGEAGLVDTKECNGFRRLTISFTPPHIRVRTRGTCPTYAARHRRIARQGEDNRKISRLRLPGSRLVRACPRPAGEGRFG